MAQQNDSFPQLKYSADDAAALIRRYCDDYRRERGHAPYVYLRTFGCQQNEADSERLAGLAESFGYVYSTVPDDAALIIYNTCAVREHAELKALSLTGQLKHLKERDPERVVCLCGCMAAQEHRSDDIKHKYPYVDFLFGTTAHGNFGSYLAQCLVSKKRGFYPDIEYGIDEGLPVHRGSRFKAWVSIMYGCNNFCTYCVVPYVRGRERSRRKEDIIAEVSSLVADGYREITLLGQNVNSYGKGSGYGFAELLDEICRTVPGDYWIRFMTSHPKDCPDKLIDVMAAHSTGDARPHIARQFHLPLQSGSDRVLKAMNRHYSREDYLSLVGRLREKMPDIALSTDIIVGFPTETEEEFEQTLSVLDEVRYDAFFSFIYSPRVGTPAASMEQLPDSVKNDRFTRMVNRQNEISLEKNQNYLGMVERVLVEGRSKTNRQMLTGRNEKNRLIHFEGSDDLVGSFVDVKVTKADPFSLMGEMV